MGLDQHGAKEKSTEIKCEECPFRASLHQEMENHFDQQHKLKELYSCRKCDFDTEESKKLDLHNVKKFMTLGIKTKRHRAKMSSLSI